MNMDWMEKTFAFLDAQKEAEKRGEQEFVCPICGGKAIWSRAKSNNHLAVVCTKCDMYVKE